MLGILIWNSSKSCYESFRHKRRWNDLRKRRPNLLRAMVYDPDNQTWEEPALAIGRSVCEVFCPYFEQDKVESAITEAIHSEE